MSTPVDTLSPSTATSDTHSKNASDHFFWKTAGILWRSHRLIIGITSLIAVLSIVISLLLPNWYMAQTRLLLPVRTASGLLSGIMNSLPSTAASSFLGDVGGDYVRYLSILDSRSVKEKVLEEFDLITVYEVEDSPHPQLDAMLLLEDNIEFVVDQDYNHLEVHVYDKDPERAANMANFFVAELNRIHGQLASQSATEFREKVEKRYIGIEADLDSVRVRLRDLQARYGIIDPLIQGQAFIEGIAEWRAGSVLAEMEYESLLSLYGPNHSAVRAARRAVDAVNNRYRGAMEGEEAIMPVPQDSIPDMAHLFNELETEILILGKLVEYVRPVLEEARLEEERKNEAVQVIDKAVPPPKKARPWRAAIVVSSTASGFVLSTFFVLLMAWWRENHVVFADRMRASTSRKML